MTIPRAVLPILPYLINLMIRFVRRTMRIRYVGREIVDGFTESGRPFILAFWHGHLFLMRYAYPGKRITILVSRHRDGQLMGRTMELFGIRASHGSTTVAGAAGLRQVLRSLREGYSAAFTPDGPLGPRHVVQPGVIQAARLAGLPIVPAAFGASKKKFWAAGTA